MSIRVGLRTMSRVLAVIAPPIRIDYVFLEGTAAPYDLMYDYVGNPGSPVTIAEGPPPSMAIYNSQRFLVRTSDGILYAVYTKILAGKYQIYVKKSADGGVTWTDETRISTYSGMASYDQNNPCIAVDSLNYLHVVWGGQATGYTSGDQIWYAKYTTSWATPVRISTYNGMDAERHSRPSIAVDSLNYLHVVWGGYATGWTSYPQIWYAKYTTSWATPVRISTSIFVNSAPCIAVDGNNYLHVVWVGQGDLLTDKFQIWYTSYTTSWGAVVRISTYTGMESYNQSTACIAVDGNNYLHVVWPGCAYGYTSYGQIWYAKYITSWATPVRISTYSGMASYPQNVSTIAVDSLNYLHVIWSGKATGYTDYDKVWYAKYTTSWLTPECLQPTGNNFYPNLRWSRWP